MLVLVLELVPVRMLRNRCNLCRRLQPDLQPQPQPQYLRIPGKHRLEATDVHPQYSELQQSLRRQELQEERCVPYDGKSDVSENVLIMIGVVLGNLHIPWEHIRVVHHTQTPTNEDDSIP